MRPRVSIRPWGRRWAASATQAARQLTAELAPTLDEQRLVNRLVAHLHHRIIRELETQSRRDLLRTPQLLEPRRDLDYEPRMFQLRPLRPSNGLSSSTVCPPGPVVGDSAIGRDLPGDSRGSPAELASDRRHRLAARQAHQDVLGSSALSRPGAGLHSSILPGRTCLPLSVTATAAHRDTEITFDLSIAKALGSKAPDHLLLFSSHLDHLWQSPRSGQQKRCLSAAAVR